MNTVLEKLENAASFVRIGLPSIIIRQESGRSSNKNALQSDKSKMTGDCCVFRFLVRSVDGEHFAFCE